MDRPMATRDKIIVALDVASLEEARPFVETLSPYVSCFKVGLELLTSIGAPEAVRFVHDLGGEVFFDGKFNDIPNTVAGAAKAAASLGVKMFNVHASAGIEAMRAAVSNKGRSKVLAVTVLTSIDQTLGRRIFGDDPDRKVLQFAREALEAGVDGIICSPQELPLLAREKNLDRLLKITPGVRPDWAQAGDQKRVLTPFEAVKAGAFALVIGRPITNPPREVGSPLDAVKKISSEIEKALG